MIQVKKGIVMITSSSNQQIKNLMLLQKKKKERDEQNVFVVEGRRMFDEAVKHGKLKKVYISESLALELPEIAEREDAEVVSDKLFKEISETVTPQGVIAITEKPEYNIKDIVKEKESLSLLLLDDIQDPGNLGTMIRTAEAAGIDAVIMSKGTVDIFNPKVTRSTMGSIFRVPFAYTEDLCETMRELKALGVKLYGSTLPSSVDFRTVSFTGRKGIVVGNEGNGMSEAAILECTGCVHIPMAGQVESLNAAVAAALLMFEMTR